MLESAKRFDEPGEFTALIGWEWSSVPGGANLHRVVITDASLELAGTFSPFSSTDSPFPEDWKWMDETAADRRQISRNPTQLKYIQRTNVLSKISSGRGNYR